MAIPRGLCAACPALPRPALVRAPPPARVPAHSGARGSAKKQPPALHHTAGLPLGAGGCVPWRDVRAAAAWKIYAGREKRKRRSKGGNQGEEGEAVAQARGGKQAGG